MAGESDVTDNCTRRSVTVEVVATTIGSDLYMHGPNRDDSTREPGETYWILVTVENLGTEWSTATTVRFYRSTDGTITTSDTEVGSERVGPLRPWAGSGRAIPLTAPSAAGTYYYGACVDAVAGESDLTNNCSSVTMAVTVTRPPPPPPASTTSAASYAAATSAGRCQGDGDVNNELDGQLDGAYGQRDALHGLRSALSPGQYRRVHGGPAGRDGYQRNY